MAGIAIAIVDEVTQGPRRRGSRGGPSYTRLRLRLQVDAKHIEMHLDEEKPRGRRERGGRAGAALCTRSHCISEGFRCACALLVGRIVHVRRHAHHIWNWR